MGGERAKREREREKSRGLKGSHATATPTMLDLTTCVQSIFRQGRNFHVEATADGWHGTRGEEHVNIVKVKTLNLETVKRVGAEVPTVFLCEKVTPSAKKFEKQQPLLEILTHTAVYKAFLAQQHRLAPAAHILSVDEKKHLHTRRLAKLHKDDPMGVYLGARVDDVIRIERTSLEGRCVLQHRVVIE